ncbi:VOC family protein [Phenylobacterium sp. LjRoot225]|uniref:VOC family protein n=1 Tax=Phenylobacterium sp. LjRoot225 TaxID=3342285 RepID=UPI003ECFE9B1
MLEGYHFQNAYVTRDVDKWVEVFRKRAKVDKVIVYEGSTPVMTPQGEGIQTNKLAFIWVGDLQYELIQPISGAVSVYADALPADDGLQFHHICMRVADWDEFRARVDQQPYPVVLEGGGDALRFVYLDARPFLGHYLEYVWMSDERWAQMGGALAPRYSGS